MTLPELAAVLAAGILAGAINTIVGAGTLITFPLLVALGIPPVTANASNTVGLVPAALTGTWGYRREVAGHGRVIATMAVVSAVGGTAGGLLLLARPENFTVVVPWLLVLAAVLAAVQPRLAAALRRRAIAATDVLPSAPREHPDPRPFGVGLALGIAATGVYGGYFGAAQGVILLALLGIAWSADLQRANGAKVVLGGVANLVSAVVFVVGGVVDWKIAVLIAVGSATGGIIGARIGRRVPAPALRGLIVAAGVGAAVVMWVRG